MVDVSPEHQSEAADLSQSRATFLHRASLGETPVHLVVPWFMSGLPPQHRKLLEGKESQLSTIHSRMWQEMVLRDLSNEREMERETEGCVWRREGAPTQTPRLFSLSFLQNDGPPLVSSNFSLSDG